MSIATWRAEYYPVPADKAEDPLTHSVLKRSGTTKILLRKHKLVAINGKLIDQKRNSFRFNSHRCGLWLRYMGKGVFPK